MEQNELKHPHISPSFDEQRSVIEDDKVAFWRSKRKHLETSRDLIVDMIDLVKSLRDKCDDYLGLDFPCWHATQFNYLAVSGFADALKDMLRDYKTNVDIAIQNWDYDNQRL